MMWEPNTPISEDCLYLNIWVPSSIVRKKMSDEDTGAAVMFWIYGGGFTQGSNSLDIYNGAILAGEQDVIVASPQYRLGPLGFLYFGHEEAPGNVGLLDQQLALEWVNSNINNFGGNPDQITLFGESAGAFSISYHMLNSKSKPLFQRGILMSGSSNAPLVFEPVDSALEFSYNAAKIFGCWDGSNSTKQDVSNIVECMRGVDPMKLATMEMAPKKYIGLNAPITVDGTFLTDTPENLLKNGAGKRADIMIGTTAEEGSLFLIYEFPKYFHKDKVSHISYDAFETMMRHLFRDRPLFEQDAIISRYTNWKNPEDSAENQRRIISAAGDPQLVCPTLEYSKIWSARGLNVYYYLFNQVSAGDPWGKWMGPKHGDDCEYAFGLPLADSTRPKGELELARKFMQLMANFARTGVPSKTWGTHTTAYPVYLDLNATLVSETSTKDIFGPRAEICHFWNVELPKLREYATAASASTCGS